MKKSILKLIYTIYPGSRLTEVIYKNRISMLKISVPGLAKHEKYKFLSAEIIIGSGLNMLMGKKQKQL